MTLVRVVLKKKGFTTNLVGNSIRENNVIFDRAWKSD